jgi:midasin
MYALRLRTREDRAHVARLFAQHFGCALPSAADAGWSITPGWLQAGPVCLPRAPEREARGRGEAAVMLPGLVEPVQAVMACVRMGWMCLVTGPAASGKTSLIRYADGITGNLV